MSYQTANVYPALRRSWQRVTWLIGLLALIMLIGNSLYAGIVNTLRLLSGFTLLVVWQQSDLFWHLGLNRSVQTGKVRTNLGIANTPTWLRGLCATYLLTRLISGRATSSALALLVFLGGILTDILDGYVARRTGTQSRLGQIADAETDFCHYLSLKNASKFRSRSSLRGKSAESTLTEYDIKALVSKPANARHPLAQHSLPHSANAPLAEQYHHH